MTRSQEVKHMRLFVNPFENLYTRARNLYPKGSYLQRFESN